MKFACDAAAIAARFDLARLFSDFTNCCCEMDDFITDLAVAVAAAKSIPDMTMRSFAN